MTTRFSRHLAGHIYVWAFCLCMHAGVAQGARDAYEVRDSNDPGGPTYRWIEIKDSGTEILDNDPESAITVDLEVPILVYGEVVRQVSVAIDGYMDLAPGDNGADFSPDCGLPALPDINAGDARIYPFHTALRVNTDLPRDPSGLFYQYFYESPHPHHNGGVHVFTWRRVSVTLGGPESDFQVLVFDNTDILMQYRDGPPVSGMTYTVGLQNAVASKGQSYRCGAGPEVDAALAVLFAPPARLVNVTIDNNLGNPALVTFRDALLDLEPGIHHKVLFAAGLDGQTLLLDQEIRLGDYRNVVVDASNLSLGLTVSNPPMRNLPDRDVIFESADINTANANFAPYFYLNGLTFIDEGMVLNARNAAVNNPIVCLLTDCRFIGKVGSYSEDECLEIGSACQARQIIQVKRGDPVVLRRCAFTQCQGNAFSMIDLTNPNSAIPRRAVFRDCRWDTCSDVPRGSSNLLYIQRMVPSFERCVFTDNLTACLRLEDCMGGGFMDTSFRQNDGLPLSVNGVGHAPSEGPLQIARCTFYGNLGALDLEDQAAEILNSTFSENYAHPDGFSVLRLRRFSGFDPGDELTMRSCTLFGNRVDRADQAALVLEDGAGCLVEYSLFDENTDAAFRTSGTGAFTFPTPGSVLVNPAEPAFGFAAAVDPQLDALTDNGGLTQTHSLFEGSPAIDFGGDYAGLAVLPATDQRGMPRVLDSDGDGTPAVNLGALELSEPLLVTTAIDEKTNPGTGVSLREALLLSAEGSRILFDPSLSGATCTLNGALGTLQIEQGVTIDASDLPRGFTLTAGGALPIFSVSVDGLVTLRKLTLREGNPGILVDGRSRVTMSGCIIRDGMRSGHGGAAFIDNNCTLNFNDSYAMFNQASGSGDGFYVDTDGTLNINRSCVLANHGEGIYLGSGAVLNLLRSTVAWNQSTGIRAAHPNTQGLLHRSTIGENLGSGVTWQDGPLEIRHCSIVRNTGSGGLVYQGSEGLLTHSIIAQNRGNSSLNNGTIPSSMSAGYNLSDQGSTTPLALREPTDRIGLPAWLSPLGWHGGPCPTYMPLAQSPAIDTGNPNLGGLIQDQRGFFFKRDGDLDGVHLVDIGAVEAFKPILVNIAADQNNTPSGALVSLREALRDVPHGGRILFERSLSGSVVNQSAAFAQMVVLQKSVTVDATSLPGGITYDIGGQNRGILVPTGSALSLHAVSLRNGNSSQGGGAIRNDGSLTMSKLALYDNEARNSGGAIQHNGALLSIDHCTLSGNTSIGAGGAIYETGSGPVFISHSTVTDNRTVTGAAGIHLNAAPATFYHTILAQNIRGLSTQNFDAGAAGSSRSLGYNLEDTAQAGFTDPSDAQLTHPMLAPLADNGGFSPTRAPERGSPLPVINQGALSGWERRYDQRGAPRVSQSAPQTDRGAHEFNAVLDRDKDGMYDWWEDLYGLNAGSGSDAGADDDLDGDSNLVEFQNGTHPNRSDASALSSLEILQVTHPAMDRHRLRFRSDPGRVFNVLYSLNLQDWYPAKNVTGAPAGSETEVDVEDTDIGLSPGKVFFRVDRL